MSASPASPPRAAALHRPPRRPYAWAWALAVSQVAVVALWWTFGWRIGLPAMLLSHAPFLWATFVPQSRLLMPALSRLPTAERVVWLTFDDGPSDDTLAVLDLLDAHAAKATFFLVGTRAARRPDLVREILRRGHGIGNHSDSHPAAWFWALGPARMRREVDAAQRVLTEIAGTPPRWFRAVVGMSNPFLAAPLHAHGLTRVAWSARGFDGVKADADAVVARLLRGLSPGAIVLLHEGAAHGGNVETLRRFLAQMQAQGYRAVLPEDVASG